MHTAFIITDLTFGDAGKGTITDALARRGADLVVRYNGGAQAAHTVIDEGDNFHIFHQFGSGSLVDGVETFLSRHMLVNPIALHYEEMALRNLGVSDAMERLHIDARALVTTPYHMILNQLREMARGEERHGSCGLGIGETAADALDFGTEVMRFGDLKNTAPLRRKLCWHRDLKLKQTENLMAQLSQQMGANAENISTLLNQLHSDDELEAAIEVFGEMAERAHVAPANFLETRMSRTGSTVFEGAQGVLLDENRGFHPYTTWSTTTAANALQLIDETRTDVKTVVLGLTRAYQTRHGAGPFPTESKCVTEALPDPHNPTNPWQGPFRAGWLDLPLLRYAIAVCGHIDGLVMTCLDRLQQLPEIKMGIGYELDRKPWSLKTGVVGDLERQEKMGATLRNVEVQYAPAPADPTEYARGVAANLGLPLIGESYGPKARDKTFRF